jgi:hypothetical protein
MSASAATALTNSALVMMHLLNLLVVIGEIKSNQFLTDFLNNCQEKNSQTHSLRAMRAIYRALEVLEL